MSPTAMADKATLPDFPFLPFLSRAFAFFVSRTDRPHVPHFLFLGLRFSCLSFFVEWPGLIRMFCIFYGFIEHEGNWSGMGFWSNQR